MDYASLAARCETAQPGRDLDIDIAMAAVPDLYQRTGNADLPLRLRDDHYFAPLAHSTRVDDALAALPKDADYLLSKRGDTFGASILMAGATTASCSGRTQALALWAAIFKQRAGK